MLRNKPGLVGGAAMSESSINTDLACCCAALKAGSAESLRLLFSVHNPSTNTGSWNRRMLMQFAVRYSNAACVRELVCRAQAVAVLTPGHRAAAAVVMQQHLQMAAARTDPWAAGGWLLLLCVLAGACLRCCTWFCVTERLMRCGSRD
jgi:hypothetical protein